MVLSNDPWLTGKNRAGRPDDRPRRAPVAQKRVRAEQAELYVNALGLKGACRAMGLGPWQIHSLRRWLRDGAPVPRKRGGKFKLSADDRAAILALKGKEKSTYVGAIYGVHHSWICRIWSGWEPRS